MEGNSEQIVFDMGVSTLQRINYQLWKCNEAQAQNNVQEWYCVIKIVYKETNTFMGKEERKAHCDFLKEVENAYREYLTWTNEAYLYKKKGINIEPPRNIFDVLFNWEMELRDVLDKKGLLIKKESSGSFEDL